MKESEARQRWCPMVRCVGVVTDSNKAEHFSPPANRMIEADGQTGYPNHVNCIASDCMMWRCTEVRWHDGDHEFDISKIPDGVVVEHRENGWNIARYKGHCGLAK
ncbi:MAG: hypothetical protein GY938_05450 [Ketobacter sp.]|nr:hypothetical protein [Ketobacter sp.]